MRRPFLASLLAACLALAPTACAPASGDDAGARPLRVVCTTGMIGDIVRNVGKGRVDVSTLMGPGVDPHLYKPTRTDMARIMEADLVFYNGLMLEGKMVDTLVRAATAGRRVHAVTEGLDETYLLEPENMQGHYDPHVWMDPVAWAQAAALVADRLADADPAGADAYRTNADAYRTELDRLTEYARSVLDTVPPSQRVLVTAHDAFNYFGRRFGFEVVGIQGISTESEAGLQDIERIVDLIVSRRVPAVFVESTVSQRNIRALVAGAAARGHAVAVGGTLFSDAMGAEGTYEGTYIGMIDHNVTTIALSLGGRAPPRGMNGRLATPPEDAP